MDSWIKIFLLALVVAGIAAAALNSRLRPWVLGALAGLVMLVVFLKFYAVDSSQSVATPHNLVQVVATGSDGQPFVSVEARHMSARGTILLFPLGLLALVFLFFYRRRHAQAGWGVAAPLAAVLVLMGGWIAVRKESHTSYPATITLAPGEIVMAPDAVAMTDIQRQPGTAPWHIAPEEPIDELWDRLNASRIPLGRPVAEESTNEPRATAEWPAPAVSAAAADVQGEAHAAATMIAETAADAPSDHETDEPAPILDGDHSDATEEAAPAHEASDAPSPVAESAPSKPRPEWVGQPPKMVDRIYRVPVEAGPYATLKECYERLREEMRTVVSRRIEDLVRESTGYPHAYVPDLEWIQIGNSYIDRELRAGDPYIETSDTSVGEMQTAWVLLEFTENHDRELVQAWKRYARRDGIEVAAVIAMSVVGILGSVFLLLKVDTWTRGYYTKRLFLGVPATIIALVMLLAAAWS